MEPDEAMKAVMEAEDDLEEVLGDEEDAEAGWEGGEGEEMCRPRDEEDEALQLDHLLDEGKFHVGVSWVHLAGLKGKREQYNGMKCLITSFGVRNPALVKVRGVEKNEDGKYIALWVKRIHCRNTVHKDTGAWKATPNPESTGATGAARWVALGRPEVDAMQGKLKFQKTPEEEAQREELFKLIDVNHNGMLSLAEIDKALPDVMGCVALFNAKPAIIRAFLAATERPPHRNDEAAFREHARAYVKPGEQFRRLIQYLHEFFEMYLIFQDMVDADEDRRIDCKEFANFIASGKAEKVGIKVTPEMMEDRCGSTLMPGYSLFNEIDEDQGGCILFKEFSDYCIRKGLRNPDRDPMESDTGKLRDMFHSAKDMDDAISIGRFVEILKKVGIKDGEIDAMIKATDKNHNYKIDVDEFIDWLMADGHHAALKRAERSGTESSGRANDGPPACKNGCGFKAAPGVTRSGKPLDTCCRGCATSGEHDQRCRQDPA
ncbi:Flagellar calcium-binding protein TB-44A (44 kDa calcimedin) (44 kDa calflagin) [Durusdinium trenchii]